MSINKAILVGNLGKDPELRYTASGQAVATFSLATTEKFKNKALLAGIQGPAPTLANCEPGCPIETLGHDG